MNGNKSKFDEWREKNKESFYVHKDVLEEFRLMNHFYTNDCNYKNISTKYGFDINDIKYFTKSVLDKEKNNRFMNMDEYKFLIGDEEFYMNNYPTLFKRIYKLNEFISSNPISACKFYKHYSKLNECTTIEEKKRVDNEFAIEFNSFKKKH